MGRRMQHMRRRVEGKRLGMIVQRILVSGIVLAPVFPVAIQAQTPPSIAIYQPTGTQAGDVTIPFIISDSDNSAVGLLAEYSTNSGTSWSAASVSSDTSNITSADYDSSLVWQSGTNLASQDFNAVWFRITPHDAGGWGTADTTLIDIDNQSAQWIDAVGTSGDASFTFWFDDLVADTSATNIGNYSLSGGLIASSISGSDDDMWATRTHAAAGTNGAMAGVIDGLLYVAGGLDGASKDVLEAYDPVSDSWTTKTSMPTGRRSAAAGVIDGKLYVAGGNIPFLTTILEVYDPSTNSWMTLAPLPSAREFAEAGVINGKLYVVGGIGFSSELANLDIYDPSTDSWSAATPMPTARSEPSVGVIDGKLYVVGGYNGAAEIATLEIYDPSTDSWTTAEPMPTARDNGIGGVIDGKLYVAGGSLSGGNLNTLEVYNPVTDSWSIKSYLPAAISLSTGGVIDGKLYTISSFGTEVFEYTALPTSYELTLTSGQTLSSAEPPVTLTATNIVDLYGNVAASRDTVLTPDDPNRPGITLWQPGGIQSGDITIPYTISDPEGSDVGLLAEFSVNDGSTWLAASVGSDTTGIELADHDSSLVWQSRTDLPDQDQTYGARFRITPHDPGGWGTADITLIDIDNLAPQGLSASGDAGDSTVTFWFDELVDRDTATNPANLSLTGGLTVDSVIIQGAFEWSVMAPMPSRRWTAAAGVINGKLYVAGGEDSGNNYTSTLFEYDPSTNTWATKTPMPTVRGWAVAGVIDGKLYVAGGTNSTGPMAKLEVYDPSTDSWTTKASMPSSTESAAAGVINGMLYVACGGHISDALVAYDPSTDSWSTLAPIPTVRIFAYSGVIDGKLYVAGGMITGDVHDNTLEAYDPSTDSWGTLTSMPTPRSEAAGAVIDGQLYIAGGWNDSGTVAEMEVYDASTDTWTPQTPMPFPERHAVAGVIDGVLYIAGGETNDIATLEMYTALPPRFELTLTNGQALPDSSTQVTLTASNISDIYGNTIATALDTTFKPVFLDPNRPTINVYGPAGTRSSDITVSYSIADPEGSPVGLRAEYSINSGISWLPAAVTGDTSGIAPANYDGSLVWQSGTDLSAQETAGIWFRITPRDAGGQGTEGIASIDIDNKAPQSVIAEGTAGATILRYNFSEPIQESTATNNSNIVLSSGLTVRSIEAVERWSLDAISPPTWRGSGGGDIVALNGKLYLAGGKNNDTGDLMSVVEVYDPETGLWDTVAPMPAGRGNTLIAACSGKLYVMGGESDPANISTFGRMDVYNPETNTWKTYIDMPVNNLHGYHAVAGEIGGKLYVNVYSPHISSGIYIFDPIEHSWEILVGEGHPYYYAAGSVVDDKLYVVGGDAGNGATDQLTVFDPTTRTTSILAAMPTPRIAFGTGVLDGKLFAVGGRDINQSALTTLEIYDPVTSQWSSARWAPSSMGSDFVAALNDTLYYGGNRIGGEDGQDYRRYSRGEYELLLGVGETLPFENITLQASNISDWAGNTAGALSVDFLPDDNNSNPAIALEVIDTEVSGDVTVGYTLTDPEGNPINLSPRYSIDGGVTWLLMTTDSDTTGITSDNYSGNIIWQSAVDEPGIDITDTRVSVSAADNAQETPDADAIFFHLDNNEVPAISITDYSYAGIDTSWSIGYQLSDTESDTLAIDAEYSLDSGSSWNPASVTGDTSGIAQANYAGSLIWHVGRDVPSPGGGSMFIRLTPRDLDSGTTDEISLTPWNDSAPHVVCTTSATGEQSGDVIIDFQISDIDDSIVGLLAEYYSPDDIWEPAAVTVSGDTSSLGAADYTGSFTWDSAADLPGSDIDSVMVRVTPYDTDGGYSDTLKVHIDNNAVPGLIGNDTSGTARDITFNFTLTDAENDILQLWGFYSIDSKATWHLMTLVEDLSEIQPGQYPSSATWRSFDDLGYARYDTAFVNLYAADLDTVGPAATDYIENLVNYVGDYSGDVAIDFSDFATLISAWNDQDTYHDIGPATGTPPDLVPVPDGEIDFEDLAVFSIMWNALADAQVSLLTGEQGVGYVRPGSRTTLQETNEHPVVVQPGEPVDVWQQDDGVVTWNIEARELAGLSAAHLVLQYDPAQLHFLDLEPGTFLGSMNGREQTLIHLKRVDPQAGILELMLGRIDADDPDVDGSGVLAVARFREIVTSEHSITVGYDLRDRLTATIAAGRYETQVESIRLPGEFALLQNYPNPFNGQTTIRFQLPSRQKVSLHIFNVRGQLVRTLLDEEMEAGYHKVAWDGRTESGRTAASGIYIYLIQAGRNKQSRKLTIIK